MTGTEPAEHPVQGDLSPGDAEWSELPADGDDLARPAADDERGGERDAVPWPFVTGPHVTDPDAYAASVSPPPAAALPPASVPAPANVGSARVPIAPTW